MKSLWKSKPAEVSSPAIMKSLSSSSDELTDFNSQLHKINKNSIVKPCIKCSNNNNSKSFLLLNEEEKLQISSTSEFLRRLGDIKEETKVKVVSIFGNTGDGKNHTLNHVLFNGEEVFRLSNNEHCCTLGVWAAYDPSLNVICLDTEGLQGIASRECERARLLLNVIAISDIIVCGIYSERLNRDLFTFLGTASYLYNHYFKKTLEAMGYQEGIFTPLSVFGPSVIVLHQTKHTAPLTSDNDSKNAEDIMKTRFAQMNLEINAFSSIKYIGLQMVNNEMNYKKLQTAIKMELNNSTVRLAREPYLVYDIFTSLNDQFSKKKDDFSYMLFLHQYFTCLVKCLSCGNRCNKSMGHIREGKPHSSSTRCKFQCQYENVKYVCKTCYKNGSEIEVSRRYEAEDESSWYSFAKNTWSGYVIECSQCGVIYRSRKYWYGNNSEEVAIRKKITHVWNMPTCPTISPNTGQRVIDSMSYISEAVTNVSLQPTKALKAWVADQVAPSYWRSNSEIKRCYQCNSMFNLADDKHHCRDCGEGFCERCSSKTKCVPNRNWYSPVRVCDTCYEKDNSSDDSLEPMDDVGVRKVTEHVVSTLNVVGSVLTYSKSLIKDSVRPSYWIPDSEIVYCNFCERDFSAALLLHHCRACGCGVCHDCSQHRKPVPHRGWDHPVRVCNACV